MSKAKKGMGSSRLLTNEDVLRIQAENHFLIQTQDFGTVEEYVLYLIHVRAYQKALEFTRKKTVIDVGCNVGFGVHMLAGESNHVVGIDVSKKAIAFAKKNYRQNNVEFREVDGKRIPFDDETFDTVISFQVVEHIADYDRYFNEIRRVLQPGGHVLLTTPNAKLRLDEGMKPWNPFHVKEFSHTELEELLREYFSDVKIEGLTGREKIYSVEFERLEKAKERHRSSMPTESKEQRSLARFVPDRVKTAIKKILYTERRSPGIDARIRGQYSTDDLFYSAENLDRSLDLLAVCRV